MTDFFPPGRWSVDSLAADCQTQFGVVPRPRHIPTAFGLAALGRFARATSHILFAYGTRDPWATMGVGWVNLSRTLPVVAIDGGSHCADTAASSPDDTVAMVEARKHEKRIIRSWLAEAS